MNLLDDNQMAHFLRDCFVVLSRHARFRARARFNDRPVPPVPG
ncbi:MAG: hypothetical protein OXK76_00085 [Gammaproteobacteria bacterium]|nr:hypothetical protein [Gammaproteobacteria bacterium]